MLRSAALAGLVLEPDEVERAAQDLTALLRDIDRLRELDTPAAAPEEADPSAAQFPAEPDALSVPVSYLAPEWREGFFAVPPAVGHQQDPT